jgi:hypothetical protein
MRPLPFLNQKNEKSKYLTRQGATNKPIPLEIDQHDVKF